MCRLTAIITRGDPILLADILTRPRRSIIQQSFNCQERLPQSDIRSAYQKASLNGDGFGVGWYVAGRVERGGRSSNLSFLRAASEVRTPASASATSDAETAAGNDGWEDDCGACVFTSLKPAWADRNLFNLAEKISSRLFFAHVRAASSTLGLAHCAGCDSHLPHWAVLNGSVSTELCCHPFRCGRFLFMHNGSVGGFSKIRRELLSLLPDPMFSFAITNSCIDSACLFAVFLALLPNSPTEPSSHRAMKEAVEQMISTICWLLEKEKIQEITLINIVVSDGESIVATRFVTNAQEVAYESGRSATAPENFGDCSPTMPASLYFATGTAWQHQEDTPGEFRMTHRDKRTDICIVTSEPLTSNPEDWMPVPRNTMILITPAIDLLLYPIASTGFLPWRLRRRRVSASSVSSGKAAGSLEGHLSVRNTVSTTLAYKLGADVAAFLSIAEQSPARTLKISDELSLLLLRSLENVVREIAEGGKSEDQLEDRSPWRTLEQKLQDLEKHVRTSYERGTARIIEDIRPSQPDISLGSLGISATELQHADLGLESKDGGQQCYELIAGSCAILCLEAITLCVSCRAGETAEQFGRRAGAGLPLAAKTFVFAGMQSGDVVIYDATSASVAPVTFQAHVGGVLAVAVYANTVIAGSARVGRVLACEDCGAALPEVFLVTGGSDTSLAVWDLSPLLFGGCNPRLLSGTRLSLNGSRVHIASDDLLAVRLTFLPHQGDVLSLLVMDYGNFFRDSGCRHDPTTRICTVEACETCLPEIRRAMRVDEADNGSTEELSRFSPTCSLATDSGTVEPSAITENPEGNLLLYIGFQSAKIGAVRLRDLLGYFRHTQVMVSVLSNAVSFQPAQQQALPLRVSRDFELKTLASGQVRVTFSGEQERESLRSLFTKVPSVSAGELLADNPPTPPQDSPAAASPQHSSELAADQCFRSLLGDFAHKIRSVMLQASHSATALWPAKSSRSGRPRCLYPPTGTVYSFEAPDELEVPLPEGAKASASPGTYRVVTSTSSLKIVAQPLDGCGNLKIEMRFLPFEQLGVQRQPLHHCLVGPWLDESGHNGFVECLTSCGTKVICSGGGDGRLLLWGEEGTLVGELSGHQGGVLCVAYTEAPLDFFCGDVRVSPPEEKQQEKKATRVSCPQSPTNGSQCLQGLLFSGSRDSSIRVWALEQLVCIQTLSAHTSEVLGLAADASQNLLISGSANGELFVWQLDIMVVALRLSLNSTPQQVSGGLYLDAGGQHMLRSSNSKGEDVEVSFTDLLLIPDVAFFRTDSTEHAGCLLNANGPKVAGGKQLWAGRGDGRLGVWNLSGTDAAEEWSTGGGEDTEEPLSVVGTSDMLERVGIESAAKEVEVSKESQQLPGLQKSEPVSFEFRSKPSVFQNSFLEIKQGHFFTRVGNMRITPGASMPSLPPLKSAAGLEPRRNDFLPLLAQFVAYKSISASRNPVHISGCIGAARFVAQLFEQALGATVDIVWPRRSSATSEFHGDQREEQPRPVVFSRLGSNPQHPTIVFYSHYDVVSAGGGFAPSPPISLDTANTPHSPSYCSDSPKEPPRAISSLQQPDRYGGLHEAGTCPEDGSHFGGRTKLPEWQGTGWNTNPWKVHCKDGYIYGRGVTDNKGPIICSLLAVKQFISEWRRKHRCRQTPQKQPAGTSCDTASAAHTLAKSDPVIPFNFVWICEGDEENGSLGLADAVEQKACWLQGARFLICNNSYWVDDTTPCLVYGMRGVLDIRVEASSGSAASGYHSGLHGGVVEEPMQSLVHLLGGMCDPATGHVTVPHFYDKVQPPDAAELERMAIAAKSVGAGLVEKSFPTGTRDPEKLLRKSWLEPSLSLLGITTSLKGKCVHVGGATRVIPTMACAEISLRLVPQQRPKDVFNLLQDYLKASFKRASAASSLRVRCLRQGRPWRANLEAPLTRALYEAAHAAIRKVWGIDPLYVREGGSMPGIPFLADSLQRLPRPQNMRDKADEVAVCQLPFGQASDNAHLPNERLGIRQVEKGVDVLACTLEFLAARLANEASPSLTVL